MLLTENSVPKKEIHVSPRLSKLFSLLGFYSSHHQSIRRVSPGRFAAASDLYEIAARQSKVARNGILEFHARKLTFFDSISRQHRLLLHARQRLMQRHQTMFSDVHQQLLLAKDLQKKRAQ